MKPAYRSSASLALSLPLIAFTAVLLSACDDDSDSDYMEEDTGVNRLVVSEDNAGTLAGLVLEQYDSLRYGVMQQQIYEALGNVLDGGCLNGGVLLEPEGTPNPTLIQFDHCEYTTGNVADGTVSLEYDGGAPTRLDAEALRFEQTQSSDYVIVQKSQLDGGFDLVPGTGSDEVDFINIEATLRLSGTLDGEDAPFLDLTMDYQGFDATSEYLNDGVDGRRLDGDLSFSGPLEGLVTVVTDTVLSFESDLYCPAGGSLTITGGDGTSLSLNFGTPITVTINGITADYDCDAFEEWMFSQMPSPPTSPGT